MLLESAANTVGILVVGVERECRLEELSGLLQPAGAVSDDENVREVAEDGEVRRIEFAV
jgi:hypothetical protein